MKVNGGTSKNLFQRFDEEETVEDIKKENIHPKLVCFQFIV